MLLSYFNDIVFDEREQRFTPMGEAIQTLSDESIRQLAIRSVFIGSIFLMILVLITFAMKDKKQKPKLYLLIVGVVLLVSTLLFGVTLLNISSFFEARSL